MPGFPEILSVDGECNDLVRRIVGQIEMGEVRPMTVPEDDDFAHALVLPCGDSGS
jgi:hypothetical protein